MYFIQKMDRTPLISPAEVLIVRIPDRLYNLWLQYTLVAVNERNLPRAKAWTLEQLKKFILENYPYYKLCAFDEVQQRDNLPHRNGMYIKLRLMTPMELVQSTTCKQNQMSSDNLQVMGFMDMDPQWVLELDSIPELKKEFISDGTLKYIG